ncbi:hypothetical protein Gorai_023027 [Gossypium raimondii]|uniref:RNase H type-1 domain-containing protein n=1 Tax=Gossypium raimondii TaxID=29730 RepID=A0A7J8NV99_GOSRA|nr:hypothetical protein [Gossypium raimondii]
MGDGRIVNFFGMMTGYRTWEVSVLPQVIVEDILVIIPPSEELRLDHLAWRWLAGGKLLTKNSKLDKLCLRLISVTDVVWMLNLYYMWLRTMDFLLYFGSQWFLEERGVFSLVYHLLEGLIRALEMRKNISSHDLLASARAWTRSFFIKGKSGKWTKKEIGGVIRGPNGELIGVFEMVVGLSDFFQIEAWALLDGIKFAWSQGYCKVEFESDNSPLIVDWEMKFCTILRESNRVADCIAKEARSTMELLVIHNDPPNSIKHLLEDDILQVGRIPFDND